MACKKRWLKQTEMQISRWIYNISLSDWRPSKEIRDGVGINDISIAMLQTSFWWFGHVEKMDKEN